MGRDTQYKARYGERRDVCMTHMIPNAAHLAASSKLQSSKITVGDLPPSSRVTLLRLLEAAAFMTARPTAVPITQATYKYTVYPIQGRRQRTPGESHFLDTHVTRNGSSSDISYASDNVDGSRREASFFDQRCDTKGSEWCPFGGFEHDSISGC